MSPTPSIGSTSPPAVLTIPPHSRYLVIESCDEVMWRDAPSSEIHDSNSPILQPIPSLIPESGSNSLPPETEKKSSRTYYDGRYSHMPSSSSPVDRLSPSDMARLASSFTTRGQELGPSPVSRQTLQIRLGHLNHLCPVSLQMLQHVGPPCFPDEAPLLPLAPPLLP